MGEAKDRKERAAEREAEMFERLRGLEEWKLWTDEELKWACKIKEEFHPILLRHGHKVSQFALQAGTAAHACGMLQSNLRGRAPELYQATIIWSSIFNALGTQYMRAAGIEEALFRECQGDLERMAALGDSGQRDGAGGVSAGGIILNS